MRDFGHEEIYTQSVWGEVRDRMWAFHARMAECAAQGDQAGAVAALDEAYFYYIDVVKGLAADSTRNARADAFLSGDGGDAVLARRTNDKSGVAVAYRIAASIHRNGDEAGSKLGSEPELIERLAVGRSTLREAIRTLEFFGVAEMQRGFGGGLTVIDPDPSLVIETAVLYLQHFGLDEPGTRSLADWLQQETARSIAARATHVELQDLIQGLEACAHAPTLERPSFAAELLQRLSRLADNRVLGLSADIAWQARSGLRAPSSGSRRPAPADADSVRAAADRLRIALRSPRAPPLSKALEQVSASLRVCVAS
jgi:DNA-binding FadR family transcriptional regulator